VLGLDAALRGALLIAPAAVALAQSIVPQWQRIREAWLAGRLDRAEHRIVVETFGHVARGHPQPRSLERRQRARPRTADEIKAETKAKASSTRSPSRSAKRATSCDTLGEVSLIESGRRCIALRSSAVAAAIALVSAELVLLPVVASAAPAAAEPASPLRAAILPLAVEGELSDVDKAALLGELTGGLQRGSFAIVTPSEVAAADADAATCAESKCYQRVAKNTQASHVVRARVVVRDRDYDIAVELVDGKTGIVVAKSDEGCEICGVIDAGSLMASVAATLRTKLDALAKGPSVLTVRSEPIDAEVTVDGELVGVTPLERPVIGGKKIVRVSKEGYIAVEREVTVVDGVAEELSFTLEKVPSRLPKRPWGFVSLGVGVAALGAGITFAVLDDRAFKVGSACKGGNLDRDGDCKQLWDTQWIVLGTTLAAATLVTLGVAVLLTASGKRGRKPKDKSDKSAAKRPSARVGVGPGSLSVRGRF